jgi:membrane protein DedA with SNARE-associated domain
MIENLIHQLVQTNPVWIYIFAGAAAFIENIFPPFPSDVAIVAVGSLTGMGSESFFWALISATIGSTLGFVTMYKVGDWFGQKILERGKIKFIPLDQVHKVERWFHHYGYLVVVGNRFLSGTRAVVSFFAGLSELSILWCTVLSFFSALLWNGVLLFAGRKLGENWRSISVLMDAYGKAVTLIVIVIVLGFVVRFIYKRQTKGDGVSTPPGSPRS